MLINVLHTRPVLRAGDVNRFRQSICPSLCFTVFLNPLAIFLGFKCFIMNYPLFMGFVIRFVFRLDFFKCATVFTKIINSKSID
ncbi:hypothetical protein CW310_15075 [Pseudomonas citronellolis]|nr:hypothetical protein CW310_15075 [Pseudomonas citronellolis]